MNNHNQYVSKKWLNGGAERKIDVFVNGKYYCSSNAYKRCKDAVASIKESTRTMHKVTAYFAK